MTRGFNLRQLETWDTDCEYYMQESLKGHADFFKQQVNSGEAQLWEVDNGETYFITRTERDNDNKKVLVICCYEGREVLKVYDLIQESCIRLGFSAIRFHTSRRGMIRFGFSRGFKILEQRSDETVLIKNLFH